MHYFQILWMPLQGSFVYYSKMNSYTLIYRHQRHFEACFTQLTVGHFITLLVMINDSTTSEFMEDCLDMFLHLQLTQQGKPIFQHVQCLGEHILKLNACIILSETLIGW